MNNHLSKLILEELASGKTIPNHEAALSHICKCRTCGNYYNDLKELNNRSIIKHPQKNISKASSLKKFQPLFLRMATLVVLAFGLMIYFSATKTKNSDAIKGSTELELFTFIDGDSAVKPDSLTFYPGTMLQFTYSCEADSYFALLGIDTAGKITQYFPSSGDISMPLKPGKNIPLNKKIVLDDYIGPVCFIGWFSKAPLQIKDLIVQPASFYNLKYFHSEETTTKKFIINKIFPKS